MVVELCQYRVSMLKMDERTLLREAREVSLEKLQQAVRQVCRRAPKCRGAQPLGPVWSRTRGPGTWDRDGVQTRGEGWGAPVQDRSWPGARGPRRAGGAGARLSVCRLAQVPAQSLDPPCVLSVGALALTGVPRRCGQRTRGLRWRRGGPAGGTLSGGPGGASGRPLWVRPSLGGPAGRPLGAPHPWALTAPPLRLPRTGSCPGSCRCCC